MPTHSNPPSISPGRHNDHKPNPPLTTTSALIGSSSKIQHTSSIANSQRHFCTLLSNPQAHSYSPSSPNKTQHSISRTGTATSVAAASSVYSAVSGAEEEREDDCLQQRGRRWWRGAFGCRITVGGVPVEVAADGGGGGGWGRGVRGR